MAELKPGLAVTPVVSLRRQLGRGGMGSVWIAHHATLDTDVVVKFLATTLLADEPSRQRFAREATAAAKVKSPHVVQILDHGVMDDGTPFIVMEHLEGEDLSKVLKERRLTPVQVASIVEQVARALDAAHRHGVIHRDVKPANIFLTDVGARDPFVKLLDFGVAKTTQNQPLTTSGELLGTPVYMSPEQVTGQPLDARSDLWALGVVAYRCLTGKRPFNGDGVAAVAYQIVHAPIPAPSSVNPALTPAVDRWFAQACSRELAQRFGSARAMADSLWAAMDIQRASDWSGETPAPVHAAAMLADTVVEGRASQPSMTGPHAITPHPSGAMELTGGSLRSSVATVRPPSRNRWVTVALVAAIPIALGLGFAASQLASEDSSQAAPPVTEENQREESAPPPESDEGSDETKTDPEPEAASSAAATASASASVASPPRRVPRYRPRPAGARPPAGTKPKVDPNDLGF